MREHGALIYFRCVAPKHQEPRATESDTLTIHERKWAYCPHDVRMKGHQWEGTGGVTLAQLRLTQRRPTQ